MNEVPSTRRVVRFGIFEVDLSSGELRKGGIKIKFRAQPFQILALLLERPGEVVTREELQKKLWPGDTFVDFEHGLNAAIKKLREALSDSADNPRFVETLPKRGYRFIYPVEGVKVSSPSREAAVEAPAPRVRRTGQAHIWMAGLRSRTFSPQQALAPGAHVQPDKNRHQNQQAARQPLRRA